MTGSALFTEWPTIASALVAVQDHLTHLEPPPWRPPDRTLLVAGCFAAFPRGVSGAGAAKDPVWAAAVLVDGTRVVARATAHGVTAAEYRPGMLALRCGAVLDTAVRRLARRPDVLLVDATGRDHPRRAGLALHLGAALDLPTVGVTHRTLLAHGEWPPDSRGATSPITLEGTTVGHWVRTRQGRRPLAVHAGWRTDPETAVAVVLACCRHRTPRPLREARHLARVTRAASPPTAAT